jgi:hypothetical protein
MFDNEKDKTMKAILKDGHIQMYNGTQWLSDFPQRGFPDVIIEQKNHHIRYIDLNI